MSDKDFRSSILGKIIDGAQSTTKKLKFNNLEILDELGRGAAGIVYKVLEINLGRIIAIKSMEKSFLTENEMIRFQEEGKTIAKLKHGNIVNVFKFEQTEEAYLLYMQYISGVTLDVYLADKKLSWVKISNIIKQICAGIGFAHSKGIVHRDLKPSNIMIHEKNNKCNCYVMDFGLAKIIGSKNRLTAVGAVMGTPKYMPPEQAQGKKDIDHRADIYSIGVILYEALCGDTCFDAKTSFALIMKIVKEEPMPPRMKDSNIPEDLEKICLKAISKEQKDRYQTAEAMILDLEAYIKKEEEYHTPVKIEPQQTNSFEEKSNEQFKNSLRSSQIIYAKKRRRKNTKRYTRSPRKKVSFSNEKEPNSFSQSKITNLSQSKITNFSQSKITDFSQSRLSNTHTKKMKATSIRRVRHKKPKSSIGMMHIISFLLIIIIVFMIFKFS